MQTILRFGLLAAILLLLVAVSEHALFLRPRQSSWLVAGAAVGLVAAGLWLGRLLFRRAQAGDAAAPTLPVVPDAGGVPAPAGRVEALGISPREYEVLLLVAQGLSNQEIATQLFISETTVKTHVSNLLAKLEAKRRTHAVTVAKQKGILP